MGSGFSIGYVNSAFFLFLLSGLAILRIDVKGYDQTGMKKEKKTARIAGWLNIAFGVGVLIGNWIIQK